PVISMTANKRPSLTDGARAGAFARIGLIAALLAAAWAGGMGAARADEHVGNDFSSFSVTDPHGNELNWMNEWTFDVGGPILLLFRETWRLLISAGKPEYTFPYIIVTAVPTDPTQPLAYGFNNLLPHHPMTAGKGEKIRTNRSTAPTLDIYVGGVEAPSRRYARKIEIRQRRGGIPDDPRLDTLTHDANSNALGLSWSPPTDDNGGAVTGYKVRWATAAESTTYLNSGGANGLDVEGGASARTHIIAGLTNSVDYLVEVAAVNTFGLGGWADAQPGTPGTLSAPSMPRELRVVSRSERLDLTWTAPQLTGGAPITNYRVRWAEGASSTNWTDPAGREILRGENVPAYTLRGLTNGATYAVQVAAENSDSVSVWSASQIGTPMLLRPAAPTSVTSIISNHALALSWNAPDDGGAPITDYKVRWSISLRGGVINPSGEGGESAGADDTAYEITGLANEVRHRVQVAAVNSVGRGAWSKEHLAFPEALPRMPSGLGVAGGGGRLNLNWSAPPSDSEIVISGYALRWAEGAGSISWVRPPGATGRAIGSAATTTYTLRGLKSATTYEVQIATRSRQGLSAWTTSAQGETASFDLDINQNGAADWMDGVLMARYLLGLRGAALTAGLGGPALLAADVAARINAGRQDGMLDVDDSQATTAADGIMIARYLLDVRGDEVTEGQTNTASADVIMNIEALLPAAP
ncbi:MAG: fibronectin type III domain-containing protein, partial [Gammaproteobacteria bacterium]